NTRRPVEPLPRRHDGAAAPNKPARRRPAATSYCDNARRTLRNDSGQMTGESRKGIFGGLIGHWGLQACWPQCVTERIAILLAGWPGQRERLRPAVCPGGDARASAPREPRLLGRDLLL